MRNKLILTGLLVAGLFALCGQAQNKYPSILWEIKKPGTAKPSYLFGTYHISDKGVFKLSDSLFYALRNVDMVATEVNANTWQRNTAMLDSMKNMYAFYNTYFKGAYINEATIRKTSTIQKLPTFISFQPNAINYFLYRNNTRQEGYEEEAYLDMFLSSAGFKLGKKVAGLENIIESEVKEIEGQKDEEAEEKEENKELPEGVSEDEIDDMIFDGYKNNSLDMMDSLNKYTYSSEAYYKKFLIARNYDQADSLDYYIRQGNTVFAAVGSAHLPGKEGVIEIMRKKGYKVRPVKLKGHDKAQVDAIKKMTVPVKLLPQKITNEFSVNAPGPLYQHFTNALLSIYSHVDMANGGYYLLSRVYNNSFYFGKKEEAVREAIDSLLYENVKGDIISRNKLVYKGYPALDVLSQLKNKDFERYRFIITPYELFKLKVGGKNNYVKMPVIDSFFNSFTFKLEGPVNPETGVQPGINTDKWHTWYSDYFSDAKTKVRLSNYDAATGTMNGCLKVLIADKELNPDQYYYKLAEEGFTSSFIFKRDENKNIDFSKSFGNKAAYYNLEAGGTLAAKTIIRHPFLYLLYSANYKTKPDTAWMAGVKIADINSPLVYDFSDSLKAVSFKLPYEMRFDSRWKSAKEKEVEKPDPDKKMNRSEALSFSPSNIYYKGKWDSYTLQHPRSLELIWGSTCTIDTNYYYPNAGLFWKNFIPKPYDREAKTRKTLTSSRYDYDDDERDGYTLDKPTGYITRLVYDTTSTGTQKLSFLKADSLSNKGVYTTYILRNNRVYEFQTMVSAPGYEPPAFFKSITATVQPFNNNKPYNVYKNNLAGLVADYKKAPMKQKPDVAERLNYYHFNVADLPEIDKALASLKGRAPENNILRKKIVEAFAETAKDKNEWPVASAWLKKIYLDANELLTIRFFAVEQVLSAHDERDAAWMTENLANNPDFKGSLFRGELLQYCKKIQNKEAIRAKVPLTSFGTGSNIYFPALDLYDSGYYNTAQMKASFDEINKLVANEKSSLLLKAEGDLFKYPETAEKKSMSDLRYDDNFQFYTSMFAVYYAALPDDPFFEDSYKKILASGTPKDRLDLLTGLAKQKKMPAEWTKALLQSLTDEKNLYMDIFKTFLFYNKESMLPEVFKNKADIARSFLKLKNDDYSGSDTLYFYGTRPSPYIKGETFYFFKYRDSKEKNEKVAYVVLPENMGVLLTKQKIRYKLSDEQVGDGETFNSVTDKLMRKQYINMLYDEGDASFYLSEKDEKSLDIDE
jgi:uncharacterized protein YbaP (TraB family)